MAARNVKPGLFDPADKLQSNTLKRHPKMDLDKTDLLRLLSYLEGELQARDVTIATLKTEKAKQMLYQAKYGRFGLGDPFQALQRDSDNMKDNTFDESAIKSMYDNQLAQLENLIATQRKAQLKMREQLAAADKRYHKVCSELEDERRKHAQDTAQGDDVTYMLEKERERLKQELDFEKTQNKRMEKDLKKTLASLEEERANSSKHKQVALMLIKERKKLIEKAVQERQRSGLMEQMLTGEKSKTINMAEGLVQESKKSLKMEAAMEKQLNEFDMEREQLRNKLSREEMRGKELYSQIESLQLQVESLQKQLLMEKGCKDMLQSIEIRSSSIGRSRGGDQRSVSSPPLASMTPGIIKPLPKSPKPTLVETNIPIKLSDSPEKDLSHRTSSGGDVVRKTLRYGSPVACSPERITISPVSGMSDRLENRVAPVGAVASDRPVAETFSGTRVSVSASTGQGSPSGVKVQHGQSPGGSGGVNLSPRKVPPAGRGTPPPIPPNKPILTSPIPGSRPAPPPKVGITLNKDHITVSSGGPNSVNDLSGSHGLPKPVHIPVSVVHSTGSGSSSSPQASSRDSSPIRKTTQHWISSVSS